MRHRRAGTVGDERGGGYTISIVTISIGRRRRRRLQWVVRAAMQAAVVRWVWVVALAAARRRRVWEGGHPLRLREVTSVATMWAVRAECCRERRVAIPFGPGRALERLGVTGDVH